MSWSLAFYVSEWVLRIVMLAIVTRKRRPMAATAWLLVIFFLPLPGVVLYALFGSNRLPRRRVEQHARLLRQFRALLKRVSDQQNVVHPELDPTQRSVVKLAEALGQMPILGGNSVELLSETEETIKRLIDDIDAARNHVHLLFYIYADDATGQRVTQALHRASKRGVTCRVLVDAVGSRQLIGSRWSEFAEAGIQFRPALPVGIFRRHMARIDLRNHRKLAIIDGSIAYTGSQNIVDAGYGHRHLSWYDLMVRIEGPAVQELQEVFIVDWYFETGEILGGNGTFPKAEVSGDIPVQILPSGPSYPTKNYERFVVAALHAAREHVTITTPYFIPDQPVLDALLVASLRGVAVDLIVPARSDQYLAGAASRSHYDDLLESGIRVHLYRDGLLHSKTMNVDNTIGLVGTGNFDIRSFALNFELNVVLYGNRALQPLCVVQEHYLRRSRNISRAYWQARPAPRRVLDNIVRLLSPLL